MIYSYGFDIEYYENGNKITYVDLLEICQGGPECGGLLINGLRLRGKFGGPPLIYDNNLYVPEVERSFWEGIKFKIAKINLTSLNISYVNGIHRIILLKEIKNGRLYFFIDIGNTELKDIDI